MNRIFSQQTPKFFFHLQMEKWHAFLFVSAFLMLSVPAFAQQAKRITGTVNDESNEPLVGVSVVVPNSSVGTTTDISGNYELTISSETTVLQFSYLGYDTQTLPVPSGNVLNVQMKQGAIALNETVIIGYGTQRKSDLTGAISNISSKDFNSGLITSPEQLINGKISGMQIMSNNGSPSAGSTIRIRGGASLNASNDPLIVLDGVPLEHGGISGNSDNFMSLINPADIESMTVLKDASSTAIYGSRASNGVIIITTKKGVNDRLKVTYTTTQSVQTTTKLPEMLSREEFINVINLNGNDAQKALLMDNNTSWNNQIYRLSYGTDNNISLSGRAASNLPMRLSLGFYDQNGILKTDYAKRFSGNLSLSPSFFKDYLKLNVNLKAILNDNRFANFDAIWGGSTFNPTLPVYSGNNAYGGYYESLDIAGKPITRGVRNPLGLLEQNNSTSQVKRIIGNFDVDYKLHFLPDLKFHATLAYDYAEGKGSVYVPAEAIQYFDSNGRNYEYGPQKNSNQLFTTYFNYNKNLKSIKSTIDATLGYDFQYWKSETSTYNTLNTKGDIQSTTAADDQRHVLISFYGRLNYTFDSRYMLTATMRRDASSRFSGHWGTFPSVALAWRLSEESFLKDSQKLSNLKLRASYGVTGQQEGNGQNGSLGNYNYIPVYIVSQDGAQAQFGNQWYYTYRPQPYVSNLKWETTTAWNYGLDFGFLNDRINGSLDYYTRQTKDLLATVPAAAGTNFDKSILTNVGNVDSKGFEFSLNTVPVDTKDFTWNLSYNMAWQKMKVKNLSLVEGGAVTNTLVGPYIDTYQFQVLTEGYAPYMFYVYHQLYDQKTGKPIEGAYADLDDNGIINSSDLYHYHSVAPDFIFGLSTSFRYKKWNLGMSFRSNVGNYVYNGMSMNTGAWETVSYNAYQLNNMSKSYLKTGFQYRQYLSDYYVENASFLKMDNLSLGYNFGHVSKYCSLNINAMIQNVFCITKYTGIDPEVPNGMDNRFYPRPRTYSLNIGFEF